MSIYFYNTLGKKKEIFEPIKGNEVLMYTCGPTVYDYVHIGNLRAFVFPDVLKRFLRYSGYSVRQVMNVTDIGHLVSDADSGEDKMTKGLLRDGKSLTLENMREMAEFYTERFKENLRDMNVEMPEGPYFASDYIKEDIELIKKLEDKNYTYKTSDGIYFDIDKMPEYGALVGGKQDWNKEGARIAENTEKRNPQDFALWKFNQNIGFASPWGVGFPGWHIECSAMGIKFLGEQFDIHTGGIDLVPTHHTNEIAQSECATGRKPFVKYWMHSEHVDTGGKKMAKSAGNFLTLNSIKEKNIDPLAYRLWLLMASYRTKVNFNWETLLATQTALKKARDIYLESGEVMGEADSGYQKKFKEFLSDDLDTPKAVALFFELMKDKNISKENRKATMLDFDKVLGLGFDKVKMENIPEEVLGISLEREKARQAKDFKKSDDLRKQINALGYDVKDTPDGQRIEKIG